MTSPMPLYHGCIYWNLYSPQTLWFPFYLRCVVTWGQLFQLRVPPSPIVKTMTIWTYDLNLLIHLPNVYHPESKSDTLNLKCLFVFLFRSYTGAQSQRLWSYLSKNQTTSISTDVCLYRYLFPYMCPIIWVHITVRESRLSRVLVTVGLSFLVWTPCLWSKIVLRVIFLDPLRPRYRLRHSNIHGLVFLHEFVSFRCCFF